MSTQYIISGKMMDEIIIIISASKSIKIRKPLHLFGNKLDTFWLPNTSIHQNLVLTLRAMTVECLLKCHQASLIYQQ